MSETDFDVIIVGAGIVGLATAYQLKKKYKSYKIAVLEKERDVALHQTGNNSGVIHSGIYYVPQSLKAKNCLEGYNLLIEFAKENNIPYELCGKVIVATTPDELPRLENLFARGQQNGLVGIEWLNSEQVKAIEPNISALKGIRVPQTGIIDYKLVSNKLRNLLETSGVKFFFNTEVCDIKKQVNKTVIISAKNKQKFSANKVVTCAGLGSDNIARLTVPKLPLRIIPFRGEYYTIKPEKTSLIRHLVYPVPDPAFPFLGVHFTRMIKGGVEAGPNAVLAFKREGYKKTDFSFCDTLRTFCWPGFQKVALKYWKMGLGEFYRSYSKRAFVKSLQRLLPQIQVNDLLPGGAGIRAQACSRDGGLVDDFYFVQDDNVIHVCNAPSPAATASLAIGMAIVEKMGE